MKFFPSIIFVLICIPTISCQAQIKNDFLFGADQFLSENLDLIKNKKLGIVTNHTAVLSNGVHLVDTLYSIKDVHITALFAPEHGIRGDNSAGDIISDGFDSNTGIRIYSLYGRDRKPTKKMLEDIDILIFDIQDVGSRFYTYISTLFYVVQAASENNIPLIVLDRPNPINGVYVDGPVRKPELSSFVGIAPIPIAHGMTVGELANYFVGEKLIGENMNVDLSVIKMKNWNRNLYYDSFYSGWTKPSPNIPNLETAIVYPGACLVEGINVSEGRGTDAPFLTIGSPFISSNELIDELSKQNIEGIDIEAVSFIPTEIPGVASNPKYKNEKCYGINIRVTNRNKFESVKFGIKLVTLLHKLFPNEIKFRDSTFDRLCGDSIVREKILEGISADEIIDSYQAGLNKFKEIRNKYLLY